MKLLISIIVLVLLTSCQISRTIEIRDARTVTVNMDGDTTQDRGRQQTDAINPDVNTGDVGAIPGL